LTLRTTAIDPRAYQALLSGRARGLGPLLARGGLWGASCLYGAAVRLRNVLYDRGWLTKVRAGVPVVSIGNLTAGGTGKTPCVEYVARFYRELGVRVAILSRGYGASAGPNDEAQVLEENLADVPHLQGANRGTLAATAVEKLNSELLVLDDGFQHRRLARDLDLVLVDATNPWGHGHLLPRGLLREPKSGLRRAGFVLLTRCDQVSRQERGRLREEIARFAPDSEVAQTEHRPLEWLSGEGRIAPLEMAGGRPVAAFCGIGNPEAFRHTLELIGAVPDDFRAYPDHHAYMQADVKDLQSWADRQPNEAILVTTQKDLVKLRQARLGEHELWALRIGIHVREGQDLLERKLREALAQGGAAIPPDRHEAV
jgi:tetraacyldisaccharide 4'-kinase